jgi:hypothetical protein
MIRPFLTINSQTSPSREQRRQNPRSRSNTAHSYNERYTSYEEPPMPEPELPIRPSIRSQGRVASSSRLDTRLDTHDEYPQVESPQRPNFGRSSTFQGPTAIYRASTPVNGRKASVPPDPGALRAQLRPASRINTNGPDVFGDPSDDSTMNSGSPEDRSYRERSVSPATSQGSVASRTQSHSTLNGATNARKGPPPPPPSRAKKPAPPPPPMKRAEISSTSVNRY